MGEVVLKVGGRSYSLTTTAEGEARVRELARRLDTEAQAIDSAIGPLSEGQLLFSVALTLADRLDEAEAALAHAADEAEALAARLEAGRS